MGNLNSSIVLPRNSAPVNLKVDDNNIEIPTAAAAPYYGGKQYHGSKV